MNSLRMRWSQRRVRRLAATARKCATNLDCAFDLLADARNHVYAVDIYVVDVTLLAPSTLGASLHGKLASGLPTSLLLTQELMERLAHEHPETVAELRRALDVGTACIVGGRFNDSQTGFESPEALLAELRNFQDATVQHLGRSCNLFGQFKSSFSLLMPEILSGIGFKAALHAAFDGGPLPRRAMQDSLGRTRGTVD